MSRSLSTLFNSKTKLQRSQLLGDTITNYRTCRLSDQATQRAADSYSAIGLMPPSVLLRAHNGAPQKTGRTAAETRPHKQMLVNSLSNVSKR